MQGHRMHCLLSVQRDFDSSVWVLDHDLLIVQVSIRRHMLPIGIIKYNMGLIIN